MCVGKQRPDDGNKRDMTLAELQELIVKTKQAEQEKVSTFPVAGDPKHPPGIPKIPDDDYCTCGERCPCCGKKLRPWPRPLGPYEAPLPYYPTTTPNIHPGFPDIWW